MAYGVKQHARPLTKQQTETLRKHATHHSKKHMTAMDRDIKKGKSFAEAHRIAKRRVGK